MTVPELTAEEKVAKVNLVFTPKKILQRMFQAERIKAHKENPPWYAKIAQFVLHVSEFTFIL